MYIALIVILVVVYALYVGVLIYPFFILWKFNKQLNKSSNKTYHSFNGKKKTFRDGQVFFNRLDEEKRIIKRLGLYAEIEEACNYVINKEQAIREINNWKLPLPVYRLMPKWYGVNDIKDSSPAVTAVLQVTKEILIKSK